MAGKELQDAQYMQQVMALLSQADADMALETSRKRFLELRRAVSKSRENFITHEPYSHFKCPLTGKVMNDPVLISTNNSFEREAIESILNELSYDGNSYNEGNIRSMIPFNWCRSFAHCLLRGTEEFKLGMVKMLAQLQLDDNRREALIQQNVIDAWMGMLKFGKFSLEHAALEALHKFSLHLNSKKCFAEVGGVPLLLFLEKPNLNMKVKATAILADLTMEHGRSFLLRDDKTPMEACKLVEPSWEF